MRPEGNPLDLNNLPEDYARDGKLTSEGSSSSEVAAVYRKKKFDGKDGAKDEPGKVYECRFCSLKFCKSQALGGHMNRHRQERETETLNKARQLVFTNDLTPGHLGYVSGGGQPIPHGGTYHQAGKMGEPVWPFRSKYPARLFSASSPLIPPPQPPPQPQAAPSMYTSPPRILTFHSQYPPPRPVNDYFVGHVLSNSSYGACPTEGNYTCIGAPVGHGFLNSCCSGGVDGGGGVGVRDMSLHNQEEGLNWAPR